MTVPRLVAITDVEQASEAHHVACYRRLAARLGPSFFVQVRDRRPAGKIASFARSIGAAVEPFGAAVVINDRLDVARGMGVTRVHLGRASVSIDDARAYLGDGAWISVAAHGIAEAACLDRARIDGALLSPIFASPNKGAPLGVAAIARWRAVAPDLPVIALGGVEAATARACLDAGAAGVAVIRAALDESRIDDLAVAVA